MPVIAICIVVLILLVMKAGQMVYYKFQDIDNVVFCPSDDELQKARASWVDMHGVPKVGEDPRITRVLRNCKRCPEHGHCDIYGNLICEKGYTRRGRE